MNVFHHRPFLRFCPSSLPSGFRYRMTLFVPSAKADRGIFTSLCILFCRYFYIKQSYGAKDKENSNQ